MTDLDEHRPVDFEVRLHRLYRARLERIDTNVRTQLRAGRLAALAQRNDGGAVPFRWWRLSVGLAVAGTLAGLVVLVVPNRPASDPPPPVSRQEILAREDDGRLLSGDDVFEMLQHDNAFYRWAATQENGG